MGYNNTVAVISNAEFTSQEIKNMLVLLRDIDKVECLDYYDAEEYIKQHCPNVVILHSSDDDKNTIKLLRKIRRSPATKNIPVILYSEFSTSDYIIEAFDEGITDIMTAPLRDYELIIRVFWAIQRNETSLTDASKDKFLAKLGIVDEKTGFYKEDFSLKYLESVVAQSKVNKIRSCLMLLKMELTNSTQANKDTLTSVLHSTVRKNDTIAMKGEDTYYIYLTKSKLSGVYAVFERLNSRIGSLAKINASVVEIQDEMFDDIINILNYKARKNTKSGELAVVQKSDFLELYRREEENELEVSKLLAKREGTITIPDEKPSDALNMGLKIMQEESEKASAGGGLKKINKLTEMKEMQEEDADVRNASLYKQTYAKKLRFVIEPLFEKYANKILAEFPSTVSDINASVENSYLRLNKDNAILNIEITYDGIKSLHFQVEIAANETQVESDTFDMEIMNFDYQKLDIILRTTVNEYRNYLTD